MRRALPSTTMVAPLDDAAWRTPTPAVGWTIATQVAHLAWTDEVAVFAATDKAAWDESSSRPSVTPRASSKQALEGAKADPADLLDAWRRARRVAGGVARLPAGQKMPWFGPPMSPTSMGTARFMETWAHSLDVAEALGIEPEPTDRIRHVAHLGVRTRNFSFRVHSLQPPTEEFRVELHRAVGRAVGVGSRRG